jgi:predicted transcriptional regulator
VAFKKKPSEQLPPMELAIMQVLWERGASTVQQVQERLQGEPAYTTVQTILNIMAQKKRVQRTPRGRAFEYAAALEQEKARGRAVEDLVQRMFGGRVDALLMNLVKSKKVDKQTLARLKKAIEDKESGNKA